MSMEGYEVQHTKSRDSRSPSIEGLNGSNDVQRPRVKSVRIKKGRGIDKAFPLALLYTNTRTNTRF